MLSIRPLSHALAVKAKDELNEVESRIPEDILLMRTWLKTQRHLKTPTDDQFLIGFLRGSKYSLQRAKVKIDYYFSIRQMLSNIYLNRDPENSRNMEIIKTNTLVVMPTPMGEAGPVILIFRLGAYDTKMFTFNDMIKAFTIFGELLLTENDNCTIGGVIVVIDLANLTMEHFLQLDLNLMKKMMILYQEGVPFRLKGFHYINTSPIFLKIFNFTKQYLSEKNRSRLYLHSTMELLYEHVPQKYLPAEYGGEGGTIRNINDFWEKRILASRDTILEWNQYGTDENQRLAKLKFLDDFYGVEGSFRKLDVF